MSEQKPREFWLHLPTGSLDSEIIWTTKPDPKRTAFPGETHVIEYSAYEKIQISFNALAINLSKAMELNKKMNAELDMHIKMFELINDWGLAGNILHYKDLSDKLERIQEEHDQPTLNTHPPVDDGSDEAF